MEKDSHHLGTVRLTLRNVEVEALELKPFVETKTSLRDWPADARYFCVKNERDLVVLKDGLFTMNGSPVQCLLKEEWTFDESVDIWVCGKESDGGGVFQDPPGTNTWFGNAVCNGVIVDVGFSPTKEEAMLKVDAQLKRMRELQ